MNEKKNIDRLFQEKFKDFEVTPSKEVWKRIEANLPNRKKKRRVAVLWWQLGGVAALIVLMLTVGVSMWNKDNIDSPDFPIVNTDNSNNKSETKNTNINLEDEEKRLNSSKSTNSTITEAETEVKEKPKKSSEKDEVNQQFIRLNKTSPKSILASKKQEEIVSNRKESSSISNKNVSKVAENNQPLGSNKNNSTLINKNIVTGIIDETIDNPKEALSLNQNALNTINIDSENSSNNQSEETDTNSLVEDINKPSIEDALAENAEEEINEEALDKKNRWSISSNAAPVYFGSLGDGSSINDQFSPNSNASDISMSYGIAGSYTISKRLKVRAGVNSVNLNYTTSNVFAFSGAGTTSRGSDVASDFGNINFNSNVPNVSFISSESLNRASAPELFTTKTPGSLNQNFGFIEVPLELEYRLLDKKFGINIIGGFSTLFLNSNEIFADIDGEPTLIGEANNMNSTSFSANFGLGIDYSLSKQWYINFEPTFKYQINTFTNTFGDFRPYFFGVYTGLSYRF